LHERSSPTSYLSGYFYFVMREESLAYLL